MANVDNMDSKAARAQSMDKESQVMLYRGLNVSQLALAFRTDPNKIRGKLAEVPPSAYATKGPRVPLWTIDKAAPYLCKPAYEIGEYIQRMAHTDLPKTVTKEYWAGMRSRQEYELRAGMLWPTSQVVEKVGEVFKLVVMTAKLTADTVEREDELTPKQRAKIKSIMRQMLIDLKKAVDENFKVTPNAVNLSDEQGTAVDDGEEV